MKQKLPIYLFVALVVVYIALAFTIPTDPSVLERYSISQVQARFLNLTVVIPLVIIWCIAFLGFIRFKQYAELIRDSNEGRSFMIISVGLMVMAFGLPVNSILSSLLTHLTNNNQDMLPTATIIKNYVGLLFAFASFGLVALGSVGLVLSDTLRMKYRPVLPTFVAPVLIVLSSVFTWLVVAQPLDSAGSPDSYYLPNWLVIFTLVIPYLAAWLCAMMAVYFLNQYRTKVKGTVYKIAFGDLAAGIGAVTLVSVLLQLLTTISGQLNRLKLTPILLIIYLLVILYAVGFWYIARGANKLKRIEEV
jgi:hypothetical protein